MVSGGIQAEPAAIAHVAKATLDASAALGDAFRAAQGRLLLDGAAFGNAATGGAVRDGHDRAAAALDTVINRFVGVYEIDADRLYQTAANYQDADQRAADRIDDAKMRRF